MFQSFYNKDNNNNNIIHCRQFVLNIKKKHYAISLLFSFKFHKFEPHNVPQWLNSKTDLTALQQIFKLNNTFLLYNSSCDSGEMQGIIH